MMGLTRKSGQSFALNVTTIYFKNSKKMIERYEQYLELTRKHIKEQGEGYVTTLPEEQMAMVWMLNDIAAELNYMSLPIWVKAWIKLKKLFNPPKDEKEV